MVNKLESGADLANGAIIWRNRAAMKRIMEDSDSGSSLDSGSG